jgi:hypothetical protein
VNIVDSFFQEDPASFDLPNVHGKKPEAAPFSARGRLS